MGSGSTIVYTGLPSLMYSVNVPTAFPAKRSKQLVQLDCLISVSSVVFVILLLVISAVFCNEAPDDIDNDLSLNVEMYVYVYQQ